MYKKKYEFFMYDLYQTIYGLVQVINRKMYSYSDLISIKNNIQDKVFFAISNIDDAHIIESSPVGYDDDPYAVESFEFFGDTNQIKSSLQEIYRQLLLVDTYYGGFSFFKVPQKKLMESVIGFGYFLESPSLNASLYYITNPDFFNTTKLAPNICTIGVKFNERTEYFCFDYESIGGNYVGQPVLINKEPSIEQKMQMKVSNVELEREKGRIISINPISTYDYSLRHFDNADQSNGLGLYYSLSLDRSITIKDFYVHSKDFIIPEIIDGYIVDKIDSNALEKFKLRYKDPNIWIRFQPDSKIKKIDASLFSNMNIVFLELPKTIISFDVNAFSNSTIDTLVLYPESQEYYFKLLEGVAPKKIIIKSDDNSYFTSAAQYSLTSDFTASIVEFYSSYIYIPSSVDGYDITFIEPTALKSIGSYFLPSIRFSLLSNIMGFTAELFSNRNIGHLYLPRNIIRIDKNVFKNSVIETLYVPKKSKGAYMAMLNDVKIGSIREL